MAHMKKSCDSDVVKTYRLMVPRVAGISTLLRLGFIGLKGTSLQVDRDEVSMMLYALSTLGLL